MIFELSKIKYLLLILVLALATNIIGVSQIQAQDPPQRQIRTFLPPEHLVSFPAATPISQFFQMLDPIFRQVTGKQIVDAKPTSTAIGVPINGQYFLDAFETVLYNNSLTYEETERYFIVKELSDVEATGESDASGVLNEKAIDNKLATSESREIRINAILFDLNLSRVKQTGFDWNVLLGLGNASQSGGGGSGGDGDETSRGIELFLKTDRVFNSLDSWIVGPDQISFQQLLRATQFLEADGIGETVAHPNVTVQSGEQGRIQIGTDIPIQVRDFAGNTITNFVSTGIIIDVTPTLIRGERVMSVDTGEDPEKEELPFIHLDVKVERSSAQPFGTAGVAIDRTTADTNVLLVDDEMTVIGGLIQNEETVNRRGMPYLKDLPPWFFGLRYLFGVTQKTITQRELLIVLQVELLDTLAERYGKIANRNIRNDSQAKDIELIERVDPDLLDHIIRELKTNPEFIKIQKAAGERIKPSAGRSN